MDKKTVTKMLEGASKKDYIEIISKMSAYSKESEEVILKWCQTHNKNYKQQADEIEFKNCWKRAKNIISEFNMYGGGPDSDEEEAANKLYKMEKIVQEHEISWDVRAAILDEMLDEFYIGNSGFDDLLIDIAESLCTEKAEIKYLADALAQCGNNYYRNYAAHLYQEVGDDKQFLKTKLANLRYGSDYVEVAKYYKKQGNRQMELQYIWQGLEKSDGRLDKLINYVAPIYIKEKNDTELQRLYEFVIKTKWDINIIAIATQLYQYSKIIENYELKKAMLMRILDTCDKMDMRKWFDTCKKELKPEDWEKEYINILEKVKKRNKIYYLDICMQTGKEKEVLECLQKEMHGYNYGDLDYNQYFSKRLLNKYPDEILALYWRDVNTLLCVTNQKNYEVAASLLRKIKSLMQKSKKDEEWKQQFDALKEQHKRKRNFMVLLEKM